MDRPVNRFVGRVDPNAMGGELVQECRSTKCRKVKFPELCLPGVEHVPTPVASFCTHSRPPAIIWHKNLSFFVILATLPDPPPVYIAAGSPEKGYNMYPYVFWQISQAAAGLLVVVSWLGASWVSSGCLLLVLSALALLPARAKGGTLKLRKHPQTG